MKNFKNIILAVLIGLCFTSVQAQKSKDVKKSLFTEFPGSIEISKNTLKNTLVSKPGQLVSIPFNEKFIFTGKVVSNEMKYADLQTMVIKSELYPNTLFQLSKISNKDNSISYVGRIMNNEAMEVYEIKSYLADNYSLQKIDLDKILQDCSY
jgi:hypothetical protein